MKKYFNINPTVYFLDNDKEGVLYNTITGDVIKLSSNQLEELKFAVNGINCSKEDEIRNTFFNELIDKGVGNFYDYNVNIEETHWGTNKYFENLSGLRNQIEIVQIELTNKCDLNCEFCDIESNLIFRKTGCKKWKLKGFELDEKEILYIIEQISLLGCKRVEVFGGDPIIEWDKLKYLIKISKEFGINDIVVHTNGIRLNEEKVMYFKENMIKCTLHLLNIYENKQMIGIGNDFDYSELINLLNTKKIDYMVKLLIYRGNEDCFKEIIEFLKVNEIPYYIDFIYKNPENTFYSNKFLSTINDYRNNLVRCNPYNLGLLMLKNSCYYNRIAISADGNVYPCILSRSEKYGNIRETSISKILGDKYKYYKSLSKDKYKYCNKCLYRYACVTCTAIDLSASDDELTCKNCSLIGVKIGNK